jgi:hypothetical protein
MPKLRKRPRPDERYIRVWYTALHGPIEMDAADQKTATRMRFLLNQAKLADKELYEIKNGPVGWPLEIMTTETEKRGSTYVVIVKQDLVAISALTATGQLTTLPAIDPDAAWAACEDRLLSYRNADFHKRAVTGHLTPDDIFPMPVRGDGRE